MRNSTFNIWYPGAAYAPQDWIDYLFNEISGNWTFSDQTLTEWNWNLNIEHNRIKQCTFKLINNRIAHKKLETMVISFHPGLKTFEEVKTNIFQFFKPKNIIYVMELFDNYNNHQLIEEIPMFETEGYICEKLVILPNLKRIYCCFELSL